jgi:hypothetical protein
VDTTRRWIIHSEHFDARAMAAWEDGRVLERLDPTWTGGFWVGGGLRKEGSKLPFEFVGEVAGTSAVAEASDIERGTATRHLVRMKVVMRLG